MSLEHDVSRIMEDDIFKPASKAEVLQRRKDSPFDIDSFAERYNCAADVYADDKLKKKIEELHAAGAKFRVIGFDQDAVSEIAIQNTIKRNKEKGWNLLHYEDNSSSGEVIFFKLPEVSEKGVEVAEPEVTPETVPTIAPSEPSKRPEKPVTPIKPTPGITPKPKAFNQDIELFLKKRNIPISETIMLVLHRKHVVMPDVETGLQAKEKLDQLGISASVVDYTKGKWSSIPFNSDIVDEQELVMEETVPNPNKTTRKIVKIKKESIKFLSEQPNQEATTREIAIHLGDKGLYKLSEFDHSIIFAMEEVYRSLRSLENEGVVKRIGARYWKLIDKDLPFLGKELSFKSVKEERIIDEKLNKCKRCGGEAEIVKIDGDWVAQCKQCDNEYHGCDVKPWTTKHWNELNEADDPLFKKATNKDLKNRKSYDYLSAADENEILKDYKEWSGGFLPQEDTDNNMKYIKTALNTKFKDKEQAIKRFFDKLSESINESMYVLSVQLRLEKYLKEWLKKHMQEVIFDEAMHGATEYKVRIDTDLSREDLRKLILSDYPIDELPEIQGMRESINEAKPTFKGVHPEKKEWIKTGDEELNKILPELSKEEQRYLVTIASENYNELVKNVQEYTGMTLEQTNYPALAQLLFQALEETQGIESAHKQQLEEMALQLVFSVPEFKIVEEAYNNDELGFDIKLDKADLKRLVGEEEAPEEGLTKDEELNLAMADVLQDMTDEDIRRRFANLMITGGSVGKHYLFKMAAERLARINKNLPTYYGILTSLAQLGYWITPFGVEQAAAQGDETAGGSEEVVPKGDKYIIKVRGATFPYLVHELVKGIYEYLALDPSQQVAMGKDTVEDETKDMIAGPGVYKTIVSYVPSDRQELIPIIQKELTKLRPDEIRDVLAKNDKGQQIMNNLLSYAMTEWDKYQKQKEEYVK